MFLGNKRDERWRARPLKPLDWRRRRRRCLTFTRVESPLPPSHVYLSIRACKDASKVSHLASELGQNHGVCRPFGHGGGRIKRVSVRVVLPWCQEHLWLSCLGLAARKLFAALAASRCLCSSCELFPSTSATKIPPVQTQFNLEAAFVRIFKIKKPQTSASSCLVCVCGGKVSDLCTAALCTTRSSQPPKRLHQRQKNTDAVNSGSLQRASYEIKSPLTNWRFGADAAHFGSCM